MMEKQKVEAITVKYYRIREKISLFSENKNYNNYITDDTDPNQVKDKYPVLKSNKGEITNN